MATCESVWFDARDAGKPIWGKGDKKSDIVGRHDGWKKCGLKSVGEIKVKGRRYLVCEEHKHQIELIATVNPALLVKLRWERRPTS
jgi:hypothetical protein